MIKIVSIIGARPQFIKSATVFRAIAKQNKSLPKENRINEVIVHTGQHYDDNMSRIFFDELQIPRPDYNLGVGSGSHGRQTGKMLAEIEAVLLKEKPNIVITYGDTNSTLAGALAAGKLRIPSAHVEAGLRSYNRRMPEEINRIVTDEISNILFCPTNTAVANLMLEGIPKNNTVDFDCFDINTQLVFQVGDVMYDSVLFNEKLAKNNSKILHHLKLSIKEYSLATIHRAENTDNPVRLKNILEAFSSIASNDKRIILPLHPRTKKSIDDIDLNHFNGPRLSESKIDFIDPVGYLDMIQLEKNAQVIFTDSGGVQKEAYFMSVPCITLRDETEWVETVQAGWNTLAGANYNKICEAFSSLSGFERNTAPFIPSTNQTSFINEEDMLKVYGDGNAAEKIVDIILKILSI